MDKLIKKGGESSFQRSWLWQFKILINYTTELRSSKYRNINLDFKGLKN